jgi:endonuclease YncB( thermonuclease family)
MRYLKTIFLTLFVAIFAISAFAQRNFAGKVVEVVDGKTVVIELTGGGKMTAALQYIETPEADQPLTREVKQHLGQLVLGQVVEFRAQRISTDVIIVGQLMLGSVDISQQMLRDGAAWHVLRDQSGQDTAQDTAYEQNQGMAKADKLGVWSVPGLKPAWEYRAEMEAKKEQERQNEAAMLEMRRNFEDQLAERRAAQKRERDAQARQQMNAQMPIWPNLGSGRIDPVSDLMKDYDPGSMTGVMETRDAILQMKLGDKTERADFRGLLVYRGGDGKAYDGMFLLGFLIRDPKSVFQKKSSLVVAADKAKFTQKEAAGGATTGPNGQYNVIFYKFDKETMTQIAYADRLEITLGGYTATIDDVIKNRLRHLLLASN